VWCWEYLSDLFLSGGCFILLFYTHFFHLKCEISIELNACVCNRMNATRVHFPLSLRAGQGQGEYYSLTNLKYTSHMYWIRLQTILYACNKLFKCVKKKKKKKVTCLDSSSFCIINIFRCSRQPFFSFSLLFNS
jgi:hypothetical protein